MMHLLGSKRLATASVVALIVALGCRGDSSSANRAIDESLAGRLIGTWDITLKLERPLSLSTDSRKLPLYTTGTVALLESGADHLSFDGMSHPTHVGVFHVGLGSLGLPSDDAGGIPDLAARVVAGGGRDSLYLVLNPETPRYSLRLAGTFDTNGASGTWVAESFLGGGGTFVMRRR